MTQFVMIPFDYESLPAEEKAKIVPICIPATDPFRNLIPVEWFEQGVLPVRAKLVQMASWWLGDPWRVSELTEQTIYNLAARNGSNIGRCPWRRVLQEAVWVARDLDAGGSRSERQHRHAEVFLGSLEEALHDPTDYAERYDRTLLLDAVQRRLAEVSSPEISEVFTLLRHGYTWGEIAQHFGFSSAEPLKRRFYRVVSGFPKRCLSTVKASHEGAIAPRCAAMAYSQPSPPSSRPAANSVTS